MVTNCQRAYYTGLESATSALARAEQGPGARAQAVHAAFEAPAGADLAPDLSTRAMPASLALAHLGARVRVGAPRAGGRGALRAVGTVTARGPPVTTHLAATLEGHLNSARTPRAPPPPSLLLKPPTPRQPASAR